MLPDIRPPPAQPMNPFRPVPPIQMPGQMGPQPFSPQSLQLPSPPQAPGAGSSPFPQMPQMPGLGGQPPQSGGAMGGQICNGIMQNMLYGNPYGAMGGTSPGSMIGNIMNQMNPQKKTASPVVNPAAQPAPAPPTVAQSVANDTMNVDYRAVASKAAAQYGVPDDLFSRQINQESGFNPKAKSPAGAIGIAQYMPDTAKSQGFDPTDPNASLNAAATYMAELHGKYGNWTDALIAYNAGEGTANRFVQSGQDWSILPGETQRYLQDILGDYS